MDICFLNLPLTLQSNPQIIMRLRIVRLKTYRFRIMSNGLLEFSLLIESISQVIVSRCIAWLDPQCRRKMPDGLLESPLLF